MSTHRVYYHQIYFYYTTMEVKSVYMDLVEGKKKGNVWKLESEAFKKPIEIKICYDNHELREFTTTCEALDKKIADQNREIENLKRMDADIDHWLKLTQWELLKDRENVLEMWRIIEQMNKEISQLYKVVADQKTRIETLSGTMLKLQETISEIQKKVTKQPTVIHDKCFVSWRESCGLWMINIPDGEYLLIAKYVVGEHNEYVSNTDEILFDKIRVEGQHYVPFYKLEWGTELDTPTATIYYDLVFMPL